MESTSHSPNEESWRGLSVAVRQKVLERSREFDESWLRGQEPEIDQFLCADSANERSALLFELLCVDLRHRSAKGAVPARDKYRQRFAGHDEQIDSAFQLLETGQLTVAPGTSETAIVSPLFAKPASAPAADPQATFIETQIEAIAENSTRRAQMAETPVDPHAQETPMVAVDFETRIEPAAADTRKGASLPTAPSRKLPIDVPPILGEYELLEELGHGGMGVVYRARQKSINRIVALKVIRPDRLSGMSKRMQGESIERFRVEAEAAARINHDNLVTVYDVGFDAGCHYFAMRYVEGSSLSELIRKNPAENRQAAEWLEPICRAVQAIHNCNVLHRDIKPHNILLENATHRTLIADFGLAKLADTETGVTLAGVAIGTPSYMSPEQFRDAANVTAQADVYSLGATLYHVLSGRPPFQAASSMQTMRQVLDTDPLPLRQLNPAVDQDLETICMKCLEKDTRRRYETAAEVGDELKRYLEGRPILARPVRMPERSWRWCKRNPLPASLIALTLFAILFGVSSLAVANVRTEASRKKSEESFQDAMSAVNDFFTRVSEERLLNEPGLQEVRRDLLLRAREYYERFLKRREGDPTVRSELAAASFRMGLIIEDLESPEDALDWYSRARKLREELRIAQPNDLEQLKQFSNIVNAMGRASSKLGKLDDAAAQFREAETLRESLLTQLRNPDDKFEVTRLHANCGMNLGLVERQRGNLDLAKTQYDTAQSQRQKALPQKPKDRAMRRDLAKGFYNLANLAIDREDEAALRDNITEAIKLLETLVKENPRDLDDQYLLSLCYRMRADLFAATADKDEAAGPMARDDYQQAMRVVQKLAELNPLFRKYQRELASLAVNLGQLAAQEKRLDDALKFFKQAQAILQALAADASEPPIPADAELRRTVEAALQQLAQEPKKD